MFRLFYGISEIILLIFLLYSCYGSLGLLIFYYLFFYFIGCYGISENYFFCSIEFLVSIELWFCDVCKVGFKLVSSYNIIKLVYIIISIRVWSIYCILMFLL